MRGPESPILHRAAEIQELIRPPHRIVGQRTPEIAHVRIDQVVARDDRQPEGGNGLERQPDQAGERHHAPADHPQHAGKVVVDDVEVERPGEPHERELEHHQPQPANQQETRQRAQARQRGAMQVGRRAGEEHEPWCAEMGDPAGEEHRGCRATGRNRGIHPDMVDRHQDHDEPRRYRGSGRGWADSRWSLVHSLSRRSPGEGGPI